MEDVRIVLNGFGGPDVLQMVKGPVKEVSDRLVRVKVEAAGVSFADVMIREGVYPNMPVSPLTLGYELVGVVDDIGENVSTVKKGDRVGALTVVGGYATYAYLSESELIKIPNSVSLNQAVALFLNYATAYQLVNRMFNLQEHHSILIHGASGGVGSALVELAKLKNVTIFGTASRTNHESLLRQGVIPIDYREEDFVEVIRKALKGGVDAVFDPIGGDNWIKSAEVLKEDGLLVGYGNSSAIHGAPGKLAEELTNAFPNGLTPNGRRFAMYSITKLKASHPEWYAEDIKSLLSMLQKGEINPAIAKVFPLREAVEAHRYMQGQAKMGKVVLIPGD